MGETASTGRSTWHLLGPPLHQLSSLLASWLGWCQRELVAMHACPPDTLPHCCALLQASWAPEGSPMSKKQQTRRNKSASMVVSRRLRP